MKTLFFRSVKVIAVTCYYMLIACPLVVSAAVTLSWDANSPAPEGYNLYQREAGQAYDFSSPVNTEGITGTSFPVNDLQPGVTYYFVVRAFDGSTMSHNSNEVAYTESEAVSDRDGDGIQDSEDAFPDDDTEWLDTDSDGIGNNSDPDDDNDGMPDSYESQTDGLDPLVDDADGDLDGDQVSNKDEYDNNTDPTTETNYLPGTPELSAPAHGATVTLTPNLITEGYSDANGDGHFESRYQIALDENFVALIFDRVYTEYLNDLPLMDLILDPETTYYWRVRFIDDQGGASQWSVPCSFTTLDYFTVGDEDADGVLDDQEVEDMTIDLDGNQVPDATQHRMMCVLTGDSINPHVSIAAGSSAMEVVGLRALASEDTVRALSLNQPETLTGMISFKVFLDEGVTSAAITIYLTSEAPEGAAYYSNTQDGWVPYADAVFSADRKSVTITLEDGGEGDQDGVENGIIVDPAGLGYSSQTYNSGTFDTTEETSCFIAAPISEIKGDWPLGWAAMMCIWIAAGGIFQARNVRRQ